MPAIFSVSQPANLYTYQEAPNTFSETYLGVLSNGSTAKLRLTDSKSKERFDQHAKSCSVQTKSSLHKLARLKIVRILSQGEQKVSKPHTATATIPLVVANFLTFIKETLFNGVGSSSYVDSVVTKQSHSLVVKLKFYPSIIKEELLELIKLSELTELSELRELDTIIDKLKTQVIRNQNRKQITTDDEYQQLLQYVPEIFINILLINLSFLRQTRATPCLI
ncbi:hypothetical protein H0A36_08950 [Endozoicomonas sp. SM1973]|uniref:Uncharacterized protein n=1 Tax=Spartinivicinus marinus TaxID=2994442 RepID=A0A853I0K9_9GAMM|nr:hypothetical protein [Spartinivicinus marinus]MCX4027139.1 hypothetical protein [Spartinivicinus marinus]NYZ66139.1 hypothetical protein [Spartinivicinus marinus]